MLLTAWIIFKGTVVIGSILMALLFAFTFIHPLKFNLKLRTSIKGQRGEVWFLHLFNTFKIGVIATPHTQDIWVKFLFWKYLIKRNKRHKKDTDDTNNQQEKVTSKSDKSDVSTGAPELTPIEPIVSKPIKPVEQSETSVQQPIETPEQTETLDKINISEQCETIKPDKPTTNINTPQVDTPTTITNASTTETSAIDHKEKETIDNIEVAEPIEVDATPISLPSEEETIGTIKSEKQSSDKQSDTIPLKQKLRNLKKRASEKYKQFKHWFKFALKKLDIIKPIFYRFWDRLKKGFALDGPEICMHYALHEHHLTGMAQGSFSILSGILQRFGVIFIPIPEFSDPMIYVRGNVTAIIKPWRLLFATLGILFEKALWIELWLLGKWYWNKRRTT